MRNNWNLELGAEHPKSRNDSAQTMVQHPFGISFLMKGQFVSWTGDDQLLEI